MGTKSRHPHRSRRNAFSHGNASQTGPVLAALDLGTNNCRLLIATPDRRGGFRVIDSFSRIVRLGEGIATTGQIAPAALDRTIAALKICAERIAKARNAHGDAYVRVIATQAGRLAANADMLVARAHEETGLKVEIISAQEEAALAAAGCAPLIGSKHKGAVVFDIGGGSTEVIWLEKAATGAATRFATSLPLGVVTLAERRGGLGSYETLRQELAARFSPLKDSMPGFDPMDHHLLGTSGTVTTLAAMGLRLPRYVRARVDGSWHQTQDLLKIAGDLALLDVTALSRIGTIGRDRADLMLPGCALFAAICDVWPSPALRVADRGLREGMLRQLAQEVA